MRTLPLLILGSSLGLSAACADINKNHLRTEEEVLSRRPKVVLSPRFTADIKLAEHVLKVNVTPSCSSVEEETVEVTTYSDRTLDGDDRGWMSALSIAGGIPLTAGTILLADAPNVYDSDANARLYNETGQETVIGLGVALSAIGLAAVMPPLVNAFRAVGESSETTTTTRQGATLKDGVPCRGSEGAPQFRVTARFSNGQAVMLGTATTGDELNVDLRQTVGPTLLSMNPPATSMAIWINEKFQLELPVSSLMDSARRVREDQDDAAWRAAEPSACERASSACAGVSSYLSRFPNGKHAAEARKLLGPRTPVVAVDPTAPKLAQAVDAAAKAMDAVVDKLTKQAEQNFQKAEAKAAQEGKKACETECTKVCDKDATCRTTCIAAVCP